ncbi:hypothetical protein LSCM1_06077 [Leishmania martiniquensis]|uniref:Uncharacterized protein n=1 Tax=Leishmania martiniquensis TaxID=1580590 RepID=A0A836KUI0_9TRYP|nr:hypothetical protein LSCM1_06077 [Leishmania martiniquensis]
MNWAGFSAREIGGSVRGASTRLPSSTGDVTRDSGLFSAGYARGGGGLSGYGGDRSVSGSFGLSGGGLLYQASGDADGGCATPRVAVIGTELSVFQQWWAIHASGLRVSVVVGTGDAKVSHSSNSLRSTTVTKAVSDAEERASAETACAVALRCVQFYRLPQAKTCAAAGGETPLVDVRVCVSDGAAESAAEGGARDESRRRSVTSTTVISSTLASVSGSSYSARKKEENCIIATAWRYFFKPLLGVQCDGTDQGPAEHGRAPFFSPTAVASPGFWPTRSGAAALSPNAAAAGTAANSLVDDVEVIYLVDYGADCDEAGARAVLLWLLERDKQIVVGCALSAETVATCAAAAAAAMRGRPEMRRLFLYRGGGCRRGWSEAAVAQLRKSLGLQRAACKTAAQAFSTLSPSKSTGGGRSVFTTVSTKAAAPAVSSDGGFSVFDFMGSSLGSALKDAEGVSRGGMGWERLSTSEKSSATATTIGALNLPTPKGEARQAPKSSAPTSIAVNAAASVVGAVHRISMVVIGRGNPSSADSAAAASLGIMDSLGWDAVAVLLHLLDWTCPDMVVGRVLRRASETHRPLCVQAEMYYGIEGTTPESSEGQESSAGSAATARPSYLCVSLHIAASGSGAFDRAGEENSDLSIFQQSLRIIGTKAVLTVCDPLLPGACCSTVASSTPPTTPTATAGPAGSGGSLFPVSTTPAVSSPLSPIVTTAATSGTDTMPVAPKVLHKYRVATQNVCPTSGQRERHEEEVIISSDEPCAEFRIWQRVRSQLNLTATSLSSSSGAGLGNYQLYSLRSGSRGGSLRRDTGGGYYDRGTGRRGRHAGLGGVGTASAAVSGSLITAEVVNAESAASDVQRAWLVQIVVESILASAAKQPP